MWCLPAIEKLNELAVQCQKQGRPERDALTIFTDPRAIKLDNRTKNPTDKKPLC